MASNIYKADIIGYGTSANVFHSPFLTASPSFKVHGIVQRSGDTAKEADPETVIYRSADELLDDKNIDLVVLCTLVIAEGHVGRMLEFSSHYDLYLKDLPGFWPKMVTQPGGGLLYGLGTHIIDQTLVLFGLLSKITGFLQSQHVTGMDDAFTVVF
ncbi:hypothetical protein QQZ08_008479 [Neonectria magnoliae]|uniref:Oxidoreductase n=1 Tax=Neonectria magnoliae TaxID=2732573 RepID=A0ABR1HVI7_9HYPO